MEKSGVLTDQILGAYGPKEAYYFAKLNLQFLSRSSIKYSKRHRLFKTVSYLESAIVIPQFETKVVFKVKSLKFAK